MGVAVMYHYVRDGSDFHCLTTRAFREQLEFLTSRYKVVSVDEYVIRPQEPDTCVLTFDDGVKDGHANVLPILREFGVTGAFFIPTRILEEPYVLGVQKRHLLFAKIGTERFVRAFNDRVPAHLAVEARETLNEYDDAATSELKYLIDHIDHETSEAIVNEIFREHFDEAEEFQRMYLDRAELRDLERAGMEVGAHGHAHRYLGKLYYRDMLEDLERSVATFTRALGHHPRIMTYPYGSQNLVTQRVAALIGFSAAFIDPTTRAPEGRALELNRYDCIDVGPGKVLDSDRRVSKVW